MGGFAGLGSSFYQVYEQPDEAYGRTSGYDTQCNLLPGWKLEQGNTIPVDIDECNDDPGNMPITITTSPSTNITAHLAHLARFSTGPSAICSNINGATAGFNIQCLPGYAENFRTFYHSHVNDVPWASQTFLYDSGNPVTLKTGTSLECGIQHLATLCNLDTSLMPPASFTIGGAIPSPQTAPRKGYRIYYASARTATSSPYTCGWMPGRTASKLVTRTSGRRPSVRLRRWRSATATQGPLFPVPASEPGAATFPLVWVSTLLPPPQPPPTPTPYAGPCVRISTRK